MKYKLQAYLSKELIDYVKDLAKEKEISISQSVEEIIREHKIKKELNGNKMLSR